MPIPWTLSTFLHAFCPRDADAAKNGRDFYGRRSNSLWFHLPRKSRRWISGLMLFALIVQIPDAICHIYFSSYLMINTAPGVFWTNLWLALQVSCQIAASCIQDKAETIVRDRNPHKFPPKMNKYLKLAYRRWCETEDRGRFCCGDKSFVKFVRAELAEFKLSSTDMLTGIQLDEIMQKPKDLTVKGVLRGAGLAVAKGYAGGASAFQNRRKISVSL